MHILCCLSLPTCADKDLVEAVVPVDGHHAPRHRNTPHNLEGLTVDQDQATALAVPVCRCARQNEPLVGAEGTLRCAEERGQAPDRVHRGLELANVPHLMPHDMR